MNVDATYVSRYTLQWHITHCCNLRCAHCYQEDYRAVSPWEEMEEVLEKFLRFCNSHGYSPQINLTGGEPLTHPDFFRLLDEFHRKRIPFSILTNGTLIDDYTARRIAVRGPLWVQISLDGTRREHDTVRGEGAFDRALSGIDALKRHNVPVLAAFTAQRSNASSFLLLALICKEHHVDLLWWDRVVSDDSTLILPQKDFRRLLKLSGLLHRLIRNDRGRPMVGCGRALQFLCCGEAPGYVCSAGKSLVAVLADGSVMPCRRLPYVIGNIRDGELEEIFDRSPIHRELRETGAPQDCSGCPNVNKCGGGSRCVTCAKTGTPFVKDPDCII